MKNSRRSAATLIEVLVALVLAIGLLGLVMTLVRQVGLSAARQEERQDPRERAHTALTILRHNLMDSWQYSILDGGARVTFVSPRKRGEILFDAGRGELSIRESGRAGSSEVIARRVVEFRAKTLRTGYLQLTLEVSRLAPPGGLRSLGPLRFSEEVLLPCIARRDRSIPYNRVLEPTSAMEPSG